MCAGTHVCGAQRQAQVLVLWCQPFILRQGVSLA